MAIVKTTSLGSFEGIEEPTVIYRPAQRAFTAGDTFANITDIGGGVFRFALRYHPDWWDGDRATKNQDRQRAEVKGLGPHQRTGETFRYSMQWRTNREFVGADRFCHIFQLKATDGDNGAPLVTLSLSEGTERGKLQVWSGRSRGARVAREFSWKPGEWQQAQIVITISTEERGAALASINGDKLDGLGNIAVYRPDATDYRPKWGLYRGIAGGIHIGEDWVEQRAISVTRIEGTG